VAKICIIGGGPGGLLTSYLLSKKAPDLKITIYEATSKLGGKISTKTFDTYPAIYEAGVAELYHNQVLDDALLSLLKKFDFSFKKMSGDLAVYANKIVPDFDAFEAMFGAEAKKALLDFINLGKQYRKPEAFARAGWPADNAHPWSALTFREIIDRYLSNEHAKRYFESIIKSDLATEPVVTNGAFGFDNYLIDDPAYCQIYTISTGIESFINALVSKLANKVTIKLDTSVKSVREINNGYRIITQFKGNSTYADYDAVIVCLPIQWIPSVEFIGELREPLANHFSHYYYPAHYLRVACLFEKPFWREQLGNNSYFRLDSFGGCCVYDETHRYPAKQFGVLNWLIAGSNAEALANLDDSLLITRALESLPTQLHPDAKSFLLEAKIHRWIGSVNGKPGGHPIKSIEDKHIPSKEHPNLLMVGDYLFDSTLNGVLDSAELATTLLVTALQNNNLLRANPSNNVLSPRIKYLLKHAT